MREQKKLKFLLYILLLLFIISFKVTAQNDIAAKDTTQNNAVSIFMDCHYCDINYIRTKLTFINYLRDPQNADVHIIVTRQRTGSGGREYTFTFLGRNRFSGIDDTLTFNTKNNDTNDEVRNGMVKIMKLGLMRYVAHTPFADEINISYKDNGEQKLPEDKWDYWVFNTDLYTRFSGEESQNSINLNGQISANRTTDELKIQLEASSNYDEDNYDIDGESIKSISRHQDVGALLVGSLDDHWSAGLSASWSSSSYRNTRSSYFAAPAVEYNLFPYSQSTRRQLRFLYKIGVNRINYYEETIFGKTAQTLFKQSLSISFVMDEAWGSIETSLEGSHYFYDLNKFRVQFWTDLSLRIFEGLSLDLYGNISSIHDQLSLAKGNATQEEILLSQKQLASNYDYYTSVGLSYSFGSIYNNIVNPRFGN